MNLQRKLLLALPVIAGLAVSAHAHNTGFDVNLNGDASTYTNNFKRWVVTSPALDDPSGFTWGAATGTGGTGGLTVDNTAANNLFYRPSAGNGSAGSDATSTFNIAGLTAGAAFSSSIDFVWSNTTVTDLTTITFGLAAARLQSAMSSNGSFGGSIIRNGGSTVTLRMRNNNANALTLDFNQSTLTAGNWYRLALDFTKDATLNQFSYTVSLLSIGAAGTSTPTLFNDGAKDITLTGTIANSVIYADADAFFGYDIRDTLGSTGITRVDNFGVAIIPEPSTCALLAGGVVILASAVRRRGVRSKA